MVFVELVLDVILDVVDVDEFFWCSFGNLLYLCYFIDGGGFEYVDGWWCC